MDSDQTEARLLRDLLATSKLPAKLPETAEAAEAAKAWAAKAANLKGCQAAEL
jgi:hypothetical protein